jgi:hypothetical protein
VRAVARVPAGYGKVSVLEELEARQGTAPDRTIYVGDGSSDVHVMLHVNNRDGFTIAVSENRQLARIAKSTVLSDNAFSIMAPVLERVLGWPTGDIRSLFEANGLSLQEWNKARTDRIVLRETYPEPRDLDSAGAARVRLQQAFESAYQIGASDGDTAQQAVA